jgi:8-oxo-dGTP diphosphatase
MQKVVGVGVGVYIRKDGKILLGKRKNSHGEGKWCPPGGHLEFGESFEECAKREAFEETGLKIKNVRFGTVTNDIFKDEGKHYITIAMIADHEEGEAKVMEPDKCDRWEWFSWSEESLPELFLPNHNALKQGFDPFLDESDGRKYVRNKIGNFAQSIN